MTAALLAAESERHLVASYSTPLIGVNSKNPAPCVLACQHAESSIVDSGVGTRGASVGTRGADL